MTFQRWTVALFLFAVALPATRPKSGQAQEADSAAIILDVARTFEHQGEHDVAEALLRYIMNRFPDSPAAREAQRLLSNVWGARELGSGRVQFTVWNTLFATWLGLAVPAALGANDPEPFGAGLLIGAPTGFLMARAYVRNRAVTAGQAGAYRLATIWATWQALGWRAVLQIGEQETCLVGGPCFRETPDEAPWTAAVVGGAAGIGAGLILASKNISSGDITLADHAALWGTWYGLALGILFEQEDDDLLTFTLLGGDLGILGSVPAARAWNPSPGQVRLASAAGLAGGVAGLGLDLLANVDDEQTAVAIPMIGTTVGLIAGAALTGGSRGSDGPRSPSDGTGVRAALSVGNGLRVGLPLPVPGRHPVLDFHGRRRFMPAVRIVLAEGRF